MTHKLTITPSPLKKWCASIAIIFTLLVLVGCASNKSTGVTDTVDTPPPPSLTLDAFLNDIPPQIRSEARIFSVPNQQRDSAGESNIIVHSGNDDDGANLETLIVEVTESVDNRPVYSIDYRRLHNFGNLISEFDITTSDLPISNVQHVAPPLRNGMNLKFTAIDYDLIGGDGDTTIDGNFYFEIYTNYGETSGETTFDENNYLTMGNWLFIPETRTDTDNYSVGSFVNSADVLSNDETQDVMGMATYTGAAYGFALLYNEAGTDTEALPLSAEVRLNADFNANTISGTINSFNIRSGTASSITSVSGQFNLNLRDDIELINNAGGFSVHNQARGGDGNLVFTSSGDTRTHNYSVNWNSAFYGHNVGGHPDRVAGTLLGRDTDDAAAESSLHLSFGAYRDTE